MQIVSRATEANRCAQTIHCRVAAAQHSDTFSAYVDRRLVGHCDIFLNQKRKRVKYSTQCFAGNIELLWLLCADGQINGIEFFATPTTRYRDQR